MKKTRLLSAFLVLGFALSACQESNTEPVPNTTSFNMTKERIMLGQMTHMDSSLMFLSCGCRFTLSVEGFAGDTNVIHYRQRDASNGAYRVALDITADTNAAPGAYAARIAVLSFGSKGSYRDTVLVEYTK